jgi:hypothetical protein
MSWNIENELKIFCVFCWRPKNSTKKSHFCSIHDPGRENAKGYHSQKRKVLNCLNKKFDTEVKRSSYLSRQDYLYDISLKYRKLSKSPLQINKAISKQKFIGWNDRALFIEYYLKDKYKKTHKVIEKLPSTKFGDFGEWVKCICMKLNNDTELSLHDVDICSEENKQLFLLFVFARYEAECELAKYQPHLGTKKGQVPKEKMNVELRNSIKQAVNNKERLGIKINKSKIARAHGVTKSWVGKLMKNMGY